jgi:acyl-ACP thioesterase
MTNNSPLTFEHSYHIRSYEPRSDGRVSIAAVCNHLQDIASRHAENLGFGYLDLQQSDHYWVLARLHVMMERMPGFGESSRITTWPSANEKLVATRDFLVHDKEHLIGKATTAWVALNAKTLKADPPSEVLDGRHIPNCERAMVFPSRAVNRLKDGENKVELKARRFDQDINNHVNSVRYVEFCLEAVPRTWTAENWCMGVDIQYRLESHAGDEYVSACKADKQDNGMNTILHSLTRISDNKEIVRMRSWWKKS